MQASVLSLLPSSHCSVGPTLPSPQTSSRRVQSALQSLPGGDRVLYVGTFNKVLFPGLRLAIPPAAIRWRRGMGLRGLEALPVSLSPGDRPA